MDFGRALGTAFTVGSGRKLSEGEVDETEQISWGQGVAGVAALIAVQLVLILWGTGGQFDFGLVRDLSIVAFGALLVPFIVFWLGAKITGTMNRLPGAFLYLGISLAVLQVVSGVLASFGTGHSGFMIGLLFAVSFLAARGFLRFGWPSAILVGLLVLAGFLGANFLLLMLPSGRLLR